MLQALIASLGSLRTFLVPAFFLGAFVPTLVFAFLNGLLLFAWTESFHNWFVAHFLNAPAGEKTFAFTVAFFTIWVVAYATASLTPFWMRTLEGKTWPEVLRDIGVKSQLERRRRLRDARDEAARISVDIRGDSRKWETELALPPPAGESALRKKRREILKPGVERLLTPLKRRMFAGRLITHRELNVLVRRICVSGATPPDVLDALIKYAQNRAEIELWRKDAEINANFGTTEEFEPTRFGNIGFLAKSYLREAYACDLDLAWSALTRVVEKDKSASDTLQACKTQLDFLVANFWLFLMFILTWTLVFLLSGKIFLGTSFLVVGAMICSQVWYGAAVEQYRVLQNLIVSILSGPIRFQLLQELRAPLPLDAWDEREIWRAYRECFKLDPAAAAQARPNFEYHHPAGNEPTPS